MDLTYASTDDLSLLRQYADGKNAGAFAELVRRHARMVFATAHRVAGKPDVAEDVAQDCFLRMAQKAQSIGGSVAAWLHTTALNRSLEILRSERSRKRREAQAATDKPQSHAGEAAELIAMVDAALAALPEELRVALVEHYLCDRSQAELAERFDVNQSTISRRIERGLERLREEVASRGGVASMAMLPVLFSPGGTIAPPATLTASLAKIGMAGVGATKSGLPLLPLLLGGGTIAAIGVVVAVVLQFSPGSGESRSPISQVQGAIAEGWAEATGKEDEDELDGMMAEIPAADAAQLEKFYEKTLDFRRVFRGRDASIVLKRHDAQLLLSPKIPGLPGPSSVLLFEADVDALHQRLVDAGVPIVAPPSEARLGIRNFTILDPEGNRITFVRETKLK